MDVDGWNGACRAQGALLQGVETPQAALPCHEDHGLTPGTLVYEAGISAPLALSSANTSRDDGAGPALNGFGGSRSA